MLKRAMSVRSRYTEVVLIEEEADEDDSSDESHGRVTGTTVFANSSIPANTRPL